MTATPVPADTVRRQIDANLRARPEVPAGLTAAVMTDTGLAGIGSHGPPRSTMYGGEIVVIDRGKRGSGTVSAPGAS